MKFQNRIRRSRLIFPVNVSKFVDKAYLRNADALVLDLEDSVPQQEKKQARHLVREAIPKVSRGGSDVFVRVNMENEYLYDDIDASVWKGVQGIVLPKVES